MSSGKPIGVSYLTGSVTPLEKLNPSFRVYELDSQTMLPVRIESHNIEVLAEDPQWKFSHEAKERYGMRDLSPNSFEDLANRMI